VPDDILGVPVPDPLIEIPDRAAFKASEVCEIAHIPPYVLRSWEKEFPGLGMVTRPGGPKVYRRGDVEQVLRIKQLLFSEGLTLAGVRRKLHGEPPPEVEESFELPVPEEVKAKVGHVKQELRSLLDLLSKGSGLESSTFSRPGTAPVERRDEAQAERPLEVPPAAAWPPIASPSSGLPALTPVPSEERPEAPAQTWPPAATSPSDQSAPGHSEPAATVAAGGEGVPEELALPLLDAEPETTTPPPAAAVPVPGRKRRVKRS